MGLSQFYRLARLSIIAFVASALVAACGDGKQNKRAPLRRTPPTAGGKVNPTKLTPEQEKAKAEALAKQTANQDAFDKAVSEFSHPDLELLDKNALEDGTYTLKTIASSLKVMPVDGKWISVFKSEAITLDSINAVNSQVLNALSAGSSADFSDSGRSIEIPMSFKVQKENGRFNAERTAFSQFILFTTKAKSQMTGGNLKLEMETDFKPANANQAMIPASVAALLATEAAVEAKDLKYSADDGKRKVLMRIRRSSPEQIYLVFSITEGDKRERQVALAYSFQKAASAGTPVDKGGEPQDDHGQDSLHGTDPADIDPSLQPK